MHRVEPLRLRHRQLQPLLRDDRQPRRLEHRVDLAGEVTPGRVRLENGKRALGRHRADPVTGPSAL